MSHRERGARIAGGAHNPEGARLIQQRALERAVVIFLIAYGVRPRGHGNVHDIILELAGKLQRLLRVLPAADAQQAGGHAVQQLRVVGRLGKRRDAVANGPGGILRFHGFLGQKLLNFRPQLRIGVSA